MLTQTKDEQIADLQRRVKGLEEYQLASLSLARTMVDKLQRQADLSLKIVSELKVVNNRLRTHGL